MYEYKDLAYASTRLNGTLIHRPSDKSLFYVNTIGNSGSKSLKRIVVIGSEANNPSAVRYLDEHSFDFPALGYVAMPEPGEASYLIRRPVRGEGYRQGLMTRTLVSVAKNGELAPFNGSRGNIGTAELLSIFERSIRGHFSTYTKAIETLEEYGSCIPFSPNFALSDKFEVLYKGLVVGKVTKNDKIELLPNKTYLKEILAETVGDEHIKI